MPSTFYIERSYLKNGSLKMLFDYSIKILNSKQTKVLEMAILEDKVKFYKKLGFKSINYISCRNID